MMAEAPPPLSISCKATRCGREVRPKDRRHAFSSPLDGTLPGIAGSCIGCQSDLIDWERCHEHDLGDLDALVASLRLELIRDNYWGLPLPEHVLRKARKRTEQQLKATIDLDLRRALTPDHFREGRQTPFADNPKATISTSAQHGTGTCCRACLEKWHGFPRGIVLGDRDFAYLGEVSWLYTERRLDIASSEGGRG